MVEYVQAVVHFTKKYQPYKKALCSLKKLETEKEAMEKELVELGKPDEFVKFEEVVRHWLFFSFRDIIIFRDVFRTQSQNAPSQMFECASNNQKFFNRVHDQKCLQKDCSYQKKRLTWKR